MSVFGLRQSWREEGLRRSATWRKVVGWVRDGVLCGENEQPIVKSMNLTADEALSLLGSWPPESRSRSLSIRYRVPGESAAATAIQTGVLLPLSVEQGSPAGTLAVFWRRAVEEAKEEDISALEELALTAGRAIEK